MNAAKPIEKGGIMVAKKSPRKQKSSKPVLKRETLKDLDVARKSKDLKGGSLFNCPPRQHRPARARRGAARAHDVRSRGRRD